MHRASIKSFGLAAAGLLPLLTASGALGQDDGAFDRTPQDCVSISSIEETDAVDDQNLIFRMKGSRVFRNHLPRRCPGLERENRFSYRVHVGRLCSTDTITVIEQQFAGLGGLRDGFTCRLGQFVPLSPAEIEEIDLREEGQPGQRAIEARSVELEPEEPAGDGAETPAEQPDAEE